MQEPISHVSFENVCKRYGDHLPWTVDRLHFQVHRGEFLTLLGPSGSGKTTCLMMLAGFENPTSGSIFIHGQSVEQLPAHKRDLGVVFQNYALFPHMTIAENLAFPLEARKLSPKQVERRVTSVLQMVRLEGLERRRPSELSGGQQQRVAIARALVFEPTMVLMDEPLGALDRRLREEMQYEIREMQRELNITVLYVTHDQEEAMVMSDRIAVFSNGCIEQIATPEELYEEPERRFVAHFIGDNNLIPGQVLEVDGDICHVDAGGVRIKALRVAPCTVGSSVSLAIRPERIGVNPPPGQYSNEMEVEVLRMVFLGDHLHLRLKVCGQSNFMIKIPNTVGRGGILEGSLIRIGWLQTDCRVLEPGP